MEIHKYQCVLNRNETSEDGYHRTIQLPMFQIISSGPEAAKKQILLLTGSNRITGAIMDIHTVRVWDIEQEKYL